MQKIKNTVKTKSETIIDLAFLPTGKTWEPNKATNKRFIESGNHLVFYLVKCIDEAKELICFTSFIFQDGAIVEAIERAIQRGVKVFVLTSTAHLKQNTIYDVGEDYKQEEFKKMLNNKLRNKCLVRCANNIHAKFILIDPKSKASKGWLVTCNFTELATTKNPELVAVLMKAEIQELFKIFVWHFWEGTTDEQTYKDQFSKIKEVDRFILPEFKSLLLTSSKGEKNSIRNFAKKIIQGAKEKIVFSTFGFEINHELGQLLLQKCKAGITMEIFARNRSKAINKNLEELAKNGAKIYIHDLLHAKFLSVDGEIGSIFTANFEKHGMDDGFEVGLKLGEKDVAQLAGIIESWKTSFSYYTKANISILNLPDNIFVMSEKRLKLQVFEAQKIDKVDVNPKNLGEVLQQWSKKTDFNQKMIKNYEFELTLNLQEIEEQKLLNTTDLTTNVLLGEYEKEGKPQKKKNPKKANQKGIFVKKEVDFNEFIGLKEHLKLPVFALKE